MVLNETGDGLLVLEDEGDVDTRRVRQKEDLDRKLDAGVLIHRVEDARGLAADRQLRVFLIELLQPPKLALVALLETHNAQVLVVLLILTLEVLDYDHVEQMNSNQIFDLLFRVPLSKFHVLVIEIGTKNSPDQHPKLRDNLVESPLMFIELKIEITQLVVRALVLSAQISFLLLEVQVFLLHFLEFMLNGIHLREVVLVLAFQLAVLGEDLLVLVLYFRFVVCGSVDLALIVVELFLHNRHLILNISYLLLFLAQLLLERKVLSLESFALLPHIIVLLLKFVTELFLRQQVLGFGLDTAEVCLLVVLHHADIQLEFFDVLISGNENL